MSVWGRGFLESLVPPNRSLVLCCHNGAFPFHLINKINILPQSQRSKGPLVCGSREVGAIDLILTWGFPGSSAVKKPPAVQETRAPSLGQEDPLEKEMATHSSILAWRIPWTEESDVLQSMGTERARQD